MSKFNGVFPSGSKVKVVKAKFPELWYANKIGQEFIVGDYYPKCCGYQLLSDQEYSFYEDDIEAASSLEEQKQELLKQIEQIDKQIADKKLEEQKKLGKKEVEIKLTLNELAWVVANVGTNGVMKTETAMKTDAFLEHLPFTFTSPVVCGDAHYNLYTKLGNLLEHTVKDFN